jgi:5-methylcytosine-specific restriction protein A
MRQACYQCGGYYEGKWCHCRAKKKNRVGTNDRGYGDDWRRLSERFRKVNPLCQPCYNAGRITAARECHHIEAIADRPDLRLDESNLVAVCRQCHQLIEAQKLCKKNGLWLLES